MPRISTAAGQKNHAIEQHQSNDPELCGRKPYGEKSNVDKKLTSGNTRECDEEFRHMKQHKSHDERVELLVVNVLYYTVPYN